MLTILSIFVGIFIAGILLGLLQMIGMSILQWLASPGGWCPPSWFLYIIFSVLLLAGAHYLPFIFPL